MKNIPVRRWVIFIVLSVASIAVYRACDERRESFYPLLADAVKAGEITRGWLPEYLPGSSRNIHLLHRVDSPRTLCAFEFSPDDSQRFRERITSADVLPPEVRRIGNPGVSWWPEVLMGDVDIGKLRERGFVTYTAVEPSYGSSTRVVLFSIDWKNGRGFFYNPPG